jgi:hypothetical protein
MKSATVSERARAWVVDYSAARMRAIRWLGDRYLLAKPINAGATAWRSRALQDMRAIP